MTFDPDFIVHEWDFSFQDQMDVLFRIRETALGARRLVDLSEL